MEAPVHRPNLSEVLQLIWRERQISRAEIARRRDLSRSTVSQIVEELLELGLIKEVGAGESKGGRRPIVLQFDDDAAVILGVDLGATHVAVTLTNLRGAVLAWQHQKHPVRDDPPGALALVNELAERCLATWGGSRRRLLGAGMAVPSPVDPARPTFLNDVVVPTWKGIDVVQGLRKRFRVPVLVDNDANLGALAERWWGAGRDVDHFAYIKLATGIGSGFFVDGKIYRGASGIAGEVGHLSVDPHGLPCGCGLRGCLVTVVGSPALLKRARRLLADHPGSALAGREFGITVMEDAALAGDALALQVVREAAEHLGVAVAGLLNLLNPAVVIVGGGLARLGDVLLDPLREVVRTRTLATSMAVSRIVTSQLGARAVAVGAATLLLQRALSDPRHFPVASAAR
ncbi:MAG: ROK family transcriptional regulator [Anaeromyxobacter sp.]|nr:ROK family transcriptional regulator [Anaeromyxobacter sp.]